MPDVVSYVHLLAKILFDLYVMFLRLSYFGAQGMIGVPEADYVMHSFVVENETFAFSVIREGEAFSCVDNSNQVRWVPGKFPVLLDRRVYVVGKDEQSLVRYRLDELGPAPEHLWSTEGTIRHIRRGDQQLAVLVEHPQRWEVFLLELPDAKEVARCSYPLKTFPWDSAFGCFGTPVTNSGVIPIQSPGIMIVNIAGKPDYGTVLIDTETCRTEAGLAWGFAAYEDQEPTHRGFPRNTIGAYTRFDWVTFERELVVGKFDPRVFKRISLYRTASANLDLFTVGPIAPLYVLEFKNRRYRIALVDGEAMELDYLTDWMTVWPIPYLGPYANISASPH